MLSVSCLYCLWCTCKNWVNDEWYELVGCVLYKGFWHGVCLVFLLGIVSMALGVCLCCRDGVCWRCDVLREVFPMFAVLLVCVCAMSAVCNVHGSSWYMCVWCMGGTCLLVTYPCWCCRCGVTLLGIMCAASGIFWWCACLASLWHFGGRVLCLCSGVVPVCVWHGCWVFSIGGAHACRLCVCVWPCVYVTYMLCVWEVCVMYLWGLGEGNGSSMKLECCVCHACEFR